VDDRVEGEKMRAPTAEYDPAPPRMSVTGGLGGGKCISSVHDNEFDRSIVYRFPAHNKITNYEHGQSAKFYLRHALTRHIWR
jgi:hypothetical protein